MKDKIFIHDLEVKCLIGIFDWERKTRQKVSIDLEIAQDVQKVAVRDQIENAIDYKTICKETIVFVEESSFHLIETLAERLAALLINNFHLEEITVRVSKPGALRYSKNVGVEITRKRK